MNKRADLKGNPAALAMIIIMLIGIVGYFVIVPPPYREGFLPELPATEYNNTFLDASPGEISPGGEDISIEKIDLAAATADNTPQIQEQHISDQLSIRKSLFKTDYTDYDFDVDTDTFSAARLHFTIAEKTGDGVLTVRLNQNTVFSREAGVGETLDISLPKYHIHEGSNTFRVSVLGPGAKIWQTNSYVLTNVRLEVDDYTSRPAEQSFSISKNTAKDMEDAELTALIKQLGEEVNLQIELNGEQIFNAIPSTSFSLDLPTDLLKDGYNTLSWSADRNGEYIIKYGKIILRETAIEEGGKRYYFSVSERDMHFVNQPSKYNCELYLLKESGADEITINLNSNAEEYTFKNGEIIEDICESLEEGTNKIILSVDDDINIRKLMLTIKNE